MRATYSLEDNKLRLYPDARLDEEEYGRVKALGFRWAPRQELFVAPMWTPARHDLLLKWCGSVEDEDVTLEERAEERSDRFEGYGANRLKDARSARGTVEQITSGIPLGQPILVGHHSERHARRDQKRIEGAMDRAVSMWETAEYWESRAASTLAHSSYVARPGVRARRIKRLEADHRRLVASYTPGKKETPFDQEADFCDECPSGQGLYCREHTRPTVPHILVGSPGAKWPVPVARLGAIEAGSARMIAHLDRRIGYERALLEGAGQAHLLEKPKRAKLPPILNFKLEPGEELRMKNPWAGGASGPFFLLEQMECTKAEWKKLNRFSDTCWTRTSLCGGFRMRATIARRLRSFNPGTSVDKELGPLTGEVLVYLTDQKAHLRPSIPEAVEEPGEASLESREPDLEESTEHLSTEDLAALEP